MKKSERRKKYRKKRNKKRKGMRLSEYVRSMYVLLILRKGLQKLFNKIIYNK